MIILGIYGAFGWNANVTVNTTTDEYDTWVHDSGATLIINGKHICSISEERLTRIKNEGNYPKNSIKYCLSAGNISSEDVDYVYIPSTVNKLFYKKRFNGDIHKIVKNKFPNAKIKIISHHLCHAASSIFSSNFNEGSFLTLDGGGSMVINYAYEDTTVQTNSIGYFNKEKGILRIFENFEELNSFGGYYSSTSHHIYCSKLMSRYDMFDKRYRGTFEGKIMGLSAYGNDFKFKNSDKQYKLSKEIYDDGYPYVRFIKFISGEFLHRSPEEKAYILQKNFEMALLEYVTLLKEENYLDDYLCLSGGSFLNVLGNSVLKKCNLFKDIHIPPCTNDTGLHFGAACYGSFKNKESIVIPENIALLGKEYADDEIENILKQNNVIYKKYDNFEDLCEIIAKKINDNDIIAWFQGRSEFGPRALGSRSILMHPGPAKNKDIINERVKHREYWRPFAGIILEEYLTDYFVEDYNSPYMLYSLTVKDEKKEKLAAITHVDGTCRIQTVNDNINHKMTILLNKLKKEIGIPAVLNTSFNDNGEPIIESPQDAIRSFLKMDIDCLAIGNFIIEK